MLDKAVDGKSWVRRLEDSPSHCAQKPKPDVTGNDYNLSNFRQAFMLGKDLEASSLTPS
jgi:hypothetical protein